MEQKIIQVGNSAGVIIPKPLLDQLNLEAGSQIIIEQEISDGCYYFFNLRANLSNPLRSN